MCKSERGAKRGVPAFQKFSLNFNLIGKCLIKSLSPWLIHFTHRRRRWRWEQILFREFFGLSIFRPDFHSVVCANSEQKPSLFIQGVKKLIYGIRKPEQPNREPEKERKVDVVAAAAAAFCSSSSLSEHDKETTVTRRRTKLEEEEGGKKQENFSLSFFFSLSLASNSRFRCNKDTEDKEKKDCLPFQDRPSVGPPSLSVGRQCATDDFVPV